MAKVLIHTFAIKHIPKRIKREAKSFIKVGKKCQAVVIKDNDELKARIITSPVEENDDSSAPLEFIVLPFTSISLSLKDKLRVFLRHKDEYNHLVCIHRNRIKANLHYGLDTQFVTLHEGLVISGYIVQKDNKRYFDYRDLIAYVECGIPISES